MRHSRVVLAAMAIATTQVSAGEPSSQTATLAGGVEWQADMPDKWNGQIWQAQARHCVGLLRGDNCRLCSGTDWTIERKNF